ncbi:MAG TPA: hypothetical protein VMW72_24485 [Sedimentisphaerales bacterium]|nr:hypothetical protein [Sedimentisphaerales bacterium]
MIGHAEHNRVDVLVLQQLSVVNAGVNLNVALFELRNFDIQELRIGIAYGDHANT